MAVKQTWVNGESYTATAANDVGIAINGLLAGGGTTGVVHDTGNETIAGVKTFSSSPIVPTPTTGTQAATKAYADSVAGGSLTTGYVLAAAPTQVAATDTAAIQAAHDALPTNGGWVILRAGTYALTTTGVTFSKKITLIGQGGGSYDSAGQTVLFTNSTTATAITVTAPTATFEDFDLVNNNAGTLTAGYGIGFASGSGIGVRLRSVMVGNFYDNIVFTTGLYWSMHNCTVKTSQRYGVLVRNTTEEDAGDGLIEQCWFDAQLGTRDPVAAIRWESSSGLRVLGCKINGGTYRYATGVDFSPPLTVKPLADLFVTNTSIENISGTAINLTRTGGSANVVNDVQISYVEFLGATTCVNVGPGFNLVQVDHMVGGAATNGIVVAAGSTGQIDIGPNTWGGVTNPIVIASGASTQTTVAPQTINNDGILLTDNSAGAAQFDYNYRRAINFTVSATPVAMWTFTVPNLTAGVVKVSVSGTYNATTGFVTQREFAYTVNGSGVVTVTDMVVVTHGATQPVISAATGTNAFNVRLATTGGGNVTNGKAEIDIHGLIQQMRRGT